MTGKEQKRIYSYVCLPLLEQLKKKRADGLTSHTVDFQHHPVTDFYNEDEQNKKVQ